jgi:hypothetical protein
MEWLRPLCGGRTGSGMMKSSQPTAQHNATTPGAKGIGGGWGRGTHTRIRIRYVVLVMGEMRGPAPVSMSVSLRVGVSGAEAH